MIMLLNRKIQVKILINNNNRFLFQMRLFAYYCHFNCWAQFKHETDWNPGDMK